MNIVQTVFGVFHHFALARELEQRGYRPTIYSTWPWWRLRQEGLPRSRVHTFPYLHALEMLARRSPVSPRGVVDYLGYANTLAFDEWTFRRLANAQPPDVLIGISGSSLKAGKKVQKEGGAFICDRGSSHQRFQEEIIREEYSRWGVAGSPSDLRDTVREEEIYAFADLVTVPSSFSYRSFLKMGVPASKLRLIPYGVDLTSFRPDTGPPDIRNRFEVVFAGQVGLRKGIPYLLKAFARVSHPNKRLRIVGAMQPHLKAVLANMPLNSVHFLGPIDQSELATVLSSSHVLVLPSVEDGFGLVMGQAMACGCPVIASTNTGADDLYTDGKEGFIVPIRDETAIADRLQHLVDDPDLRIRLSAASQDRVKAIEGWKEYGDKWESLLHSLVRVRAI
jgi:starch synthase